MMKSFREATNVFFSLLLAAILFAATPQPAFSSQPEKQSTEKQQKTVEKQPVSSRHSATIGGREISYTATAGQLPIMNDSGETEANIFYVAYSRSEEHTSELQSLR